MTNKTALTPLKATLVKNKGGRPLKVTPERFKQVYQEYIGECAQNGIVPFQVELARRLDISKESMNDYAKRSPYDSLIKRLTTMTESMLLQHGITNNKPVMPIFLLKSLFGYQEAATKMDVTLNQGVVQLPTRQ